MFLVIINKIISALVSAILAVTGFFGAVDAERVSAKQYEISGTGSCGAGEGRVGVHDPSIMQSVDGTYYIFGTHGCAAKSEDALNWTSIACGINDNNPLLVPEGKTLRSALSEPLSWTDAYQQVNGYSEDSWQTNVWAADVIYNEAMGKYCYYGSSSVWGTTGSVIWLATSDSIEGPYVYEKCIVYSGFNNLTNDGKFYSRVNSLHYSFTNIPDLFESGVYKLSEIKNAPWFDEFGNYNSSLYPNCIDPALFYDKDGQLWMSYGSYFGGIYVMPLVENTGLPDYEYMKSHSDYDMYFGKRLIATTFANDLSGEGPYILYSSESGYYYLFISYGGLNSLGGYNTRVYRSENADGPYVDAAGNSALDDVNTGVKLFGNYKFDCLDTAYLSGGHCSAMVNDAGEILISYHTRFGYGNESYQTRVHQAVINENGWLTVLPFEYTGEGVKTENITSEQICGEYEFIAHGTITNACNDWADLNKIITPTQTVLFNADGTVTGLKAYESEKANTAVSSDEVTGIWKVTDGTAFVTITVGDTEYEGVFCLQKDESAHRGEALVFSAVGENNECLWGVKK